MFSHTFNSTSSSGSIDIQPFPPPPEAGSFTGTITVNACMSGTWPACNHAPGSPKTINVTYNVLGLSVTPEQLTFSSTGANPGTQTATIAVTDGSPSYTWRVSYSPSVTDWLRVTPSGGTPDVSKGPQTLTFNVNAAGLPAGVHSATVTFNTSASVIARMAVTLFVGDPSVNFVAPYVVPAGGSDNVIIRGRGFSALSPDTLSVRFNSTPATAAVVISDTEIRATYPPLAAGSYPISVSSGATSIPSRAALKLVVIDPPAFPLHTIARPASAGQPANLIYDAERQALLFTDSANGRILRYALSGNGDASTDVGWYIGHITLSPDGTELIRTAPDGRLYRLDPVTLAVLSSVDPFPSRGHGSLSWLAFADDGGGIGSAWWGDGSILLYRYDMLTQTFTPLSFQTYMYDRQISASADGHTLVLSSPGSMADERTYIYDASTGALTPRPATGIGYHRPGVSRNGSRIILFDARSSTWTVYDAAFNAFGTLPNDANRFVLSPDGNYVYGYISASGQVRKFSIGAGGVTEVGSGNVVAPANTEMWEMTISPDGGTLFLVGTTSVVVAPAP
jgi:hypothetical protein